MKNIVILILAFIIAFSSVFLSGCDKKEDNPAPTEATVATETKPAETRTGELLDYEKSFIEGKNPLYGAWKLSNMDFMYIVFRNDNLAELAMGSEGYLSKYKYNKKAGTLAVQLLPGTIDGKYECEFSDDNTELFLTLDGNTLELIKDKSFSLVPKAPKNAVIDEEILGWWKNEDGMEYYFGGDGLMYNNAIARETYYTYSAKDQKITAVYNYGGELDETLSYKLKGDTLIIDGEKYTKKGSVA